MMNTKAANWAAGMLYVISAGLGWAGTEGAESTFYGHNAGLVNSDDLNENTFIGAGAGHDNTDGAQNTFVGRQAGYSTVYGFENTFLGRFAGHGNTDGSVNTFVGASAGSSNTTGDSNVYAGAGAGFFNTTGNYNTFLGYSAGESSTTGLQNTFVGANSGQANQTGHANVFLGFDAGSNETGSNKLYIDSCQDGPPCTNPLVYGEFDNHLLHINGVTSVSANNVAKSQMHFSLDNGDYGGFLTSVLQNNFYVSSGARFDTTTWVQRSTDGNAVMAGSGGVGYRIFTHTGSTVGSTFTPTLRLHIDYSGQFGINTAPVAGDEIHTSSGAHLTSGGVWTDASSREYKEHIRPLTAEEAQQTLAALDPVRYNYKANPREKHVGFIAEDVPELVAREDRKSLSPMDIVAVLTKVVQEQRQTIAGQKEELAHAQDQLSALASRIERLERGSSQN